MPFLAVIICIDVEPDLRLIYSADEWQGFGPTLRSFETFRTKLERATGAPVCFNWFLRMDEQIKKIYGTHSWVVERFAAEINSLDEAGDEIGLHTHGWRWNNKQNDWVADYADQDWIDAALERSFDAYRQALGRKCESFRFGDHWMNNATMSTLRSLGTKFDLTIEPGRVTELWHHEEFLGTYPDYERVPTHPYKPSQIDFRKPVESGAEPWVIPISTGKIPGRFPRMKRLLNSRSTPVLPLDLSLYPPNFRAIVEQTLEADGQWHLAVVVRSDACLNYKTRRVVTQNVEYLTSHPLAGCFRIVRPSAAIDLLQLSVPTVETQSSAA